jgi:hypothetical protein
MPARDTSGPKTYDRMSDYYADQEIFPTHSPFATRERLLVHEYERRRALTDRLYLPPRIFQDARVLEFGPDTGENALVFALWGADCTLVEPNTNAHATIREYFERFGLTGRLTAIVQSDLAGFASRPEAAASYDVIVAEGFIYSVKPESLWINLFAKLLKDEGFALFSFYDPTSCFIELMLKVIHSTACEWSGRSRQETARALYGAKWNSIPHRRSLDSWIMDVLENPFVRLKYFIDARALCSSMHDAGLTLYSAWPPYADGLEVTWFKNVQSMAQRLASQRRFITRSLLGHLFGRPIFLVDDRSDVQALLTELLGLIDRMIDRFEPARADRAAAILSALDAILQSGRVLVSEQDQACALGLTGSYRTILALLARGRFDELASFCNTDAAFIRDWGSPNHNAVFTRPGARPPAVP